MPSSSECINVPEPILQIIIRLLVQELPPYPNFLNLLNRLLQVFSFYAFSNMTFDYFTTDILFFKCRWQPDNDHVSSHAQCCYQVVMGCLKHNQRFCKVRWLDRLVLHDFYSSLQRNRTYEKTSGVLQSYHLFCSLHQAHDRIILDLNLLNWR